MITRPFTLGAETPGVKLFRDGTHRLVPPEATVERLLPVLRYAGITRIANVTGLDHIGLPVVVVCRPNSRSLSVSQGKGITLAAAKASGLMESLEGWSAEHITLPLKLGSDRELRRTHSMVDPATLPQLSVSRFHENLRILWIEGYDLIERAPIWVPYEMVHLDLTLPLPPGSGCFPMGSNGLASGNHILEAVAHGICEVIERDADTLWKLGGEPLERATRVDLAGVEDGACREVIAQFLRAGMLVAVWEMTSDTGVPVFQCTIIDRETNPLRPLYPSSGTGCHPAREIALLRALTEAAQSRLTRISSSRDDVPRSDYELTRNPDMLDRIRKSLSAQGAVRRFEDAPTVTYDTFEEDVQWLLQRLCAAGISRVIAVDLSEPALGISVVRVLIPGMEPKADSPGYVAGARALKHSVARTAEP